MQISLFYRGDALRITMAHMKKREPIPEISPIVRKWLPDANDEELKLATFRLRDYLSQVYRIFLRLEAEGKLPVPRDNYLDDGRVEANINKDV